jgi:hypothetical protein
MDEPRKPMELIKQSDAMALFLDAARQVRDMGAVRFAAMGFEVVFERADAPKREHEAPRKRTYDEKPAEERALLQRAETLLRGAGNGG